MQDDPPEDDDMFCDENPEEDSLLEYSTEGDIPWYSGYDDFDEAPCKSYIRKLLGKCLVSFVIIFLLILIPMILYGYVCWIKSMMH